MSARSVRDGFVPWPEAFASRYRANGWWAGESLGSLPDEWALARPHTVAVLDRDRAITFDELARRVRGLAHQLTRLGLRGGPDGDRIIVQLPNTAELIILVLACARIGVVPVLALPAHRETELRYLAEFSEAAAIAVPRNFRGFDHAGLAAKLAGELPLIKHILVLPTDHEPLQHGHLDLRALTEPVTKPPAAALQPAPSDVALLLLSGGTTGLPKLIPRTHDDYVYNLRASARACGFGEQTVFMASLPVSHNFGLGCPGVLGVLDAGGRVVLLPSPEPKAALDAINRYRVTDVAAVPAVVQRWMEEVRAASLALPSLRGVQVGGARLAEEIARQVGPVLGATLQQALGMAEGLINYTRPDDPADIACLTQGRPVSPGDEVRIVGPDGVDVADGEPGELLARGPYTIRGYWRAPDHNERAFTSDGWYRTGDLVRRHPTGNLIVEGRVKDVINRGGEKISAEEVENLLYGLPGIARAAAVAAPDPVLGERVAAVIVPADPASTPSLEEVRDALTAAGVARFKIPELLVAVEEIPLTKVGKIDKVSLREMVAHARPGGDRT